MSDLSEPPVLDDAERALLRRLAGAIIGPSRELDLPGADDERIAARVLERASAMADRVRGPMRDCFAGHGGVAAAAASDDAAFSALIEDVRRSRHPFLATMMTLTAQAYYEDPRVLVSLHREPRPPFPGGHVLEQGDWSLLDAVKRRPPMYRS